MAVWAGVGSGRARAGPSRAMVAAGAEIDGEESWQKGDVRGEVDAGCRGDEAKRKGWPDRLFDRRGEAGAGAGELGGGGFCFGVALVVLD